MLTMIKTRQARSSLVIQMTVFVSLGASVMSTICTPGGQTLSFKFWELDPLSKVPPGVQYTQKLFQSDVDNYTIHFTNYTFGLSATYRASDYFTIGYNSPGKGYFISMIKGIDREGNLSATSDDVNELRYQIVCNSINSSNVTSILRIQIEDVNDHKPVFSSPKFTVKINESTDLGVSISVISSTDLDLGSNKLATYKLNSSPGAMFDGSKYFTIRGDGSVVVTGYLDFESMYAAANYQSSQVYYNVTITATDSGMPQLSSSTILIIYIQDDDDQGPGFVYPSCITRPDERKPPACIGQRYRSSISSNTVQMTNYSLQMTADVNSPGNPINIVMQDKDTLNSRVNCSVSNTIPGGYTQLFQATSTQIGQTKQYRCDVLYVPGVNTSLGSLGLDEIVVIIKAEETQFYKRSEYAGIVVAITGSSSSYCPAGYNTKTTNLGVVICTATPEKDTSVALALGLGITLGVAILIIIILSIVVVVMLKRWKLATDKNVLNYNTVDMTLQDGHAYDGINSNGTDSGTSRYQNYHIGQSDKQTDKQTDLSTQSHIYDDLVDGSIIRRDRDLSESGGYANVTAEI